MAAQLPLDIGHPPSFSRDDMVITKANTAAVAFVDGWPGWPAPIAMLVGPKGSGKSHLGRVWCGASGATQLFQNLDTQLRLLSVKIVSKSIMRCRFRIRVVKPFLLIFSSF
ncbi:MAG: hypothetical protein AAF141_13830, partial [Pseudomonadota bacterium]